MENLCKAVEKLKALALTLWSFQDSMVGWMISWVCPHWVIDRPWMTVHQRVELMGGTKQPPHLATKNRKNNITCWTRRQSPSTNMNVFFVFLLAGRWSFFCFCVRLNLTKQTFLSLSGCSIKRKALVNVTLLFHSRNSSFDFLNTPPQQNMEKDSAHFAWTLLSAKAID